MQKRSSARNRSSLNDLVLTDAIAIASRSQLQDLLALIVDSALTPPVLLTKLRARAIGLGLGPHGVVSPLCGSGPSPWLSPPAFALSCVLDFLLVPDLVSVDMVCKRWLHRTHHDVGWPRIHWEDNDESPDGRGMMSEGQLALFLINGLRDRPLQLTRSLHLTLTDEDPLSWFPAMPQLVELDLFDLGTAFQGQHAQEAARKLFPPSLRTLRLSSRRPLSLHFLTLCTSLTSLSCQTVGVGALAMIASLRDLCVLDLGDEIAGRNPKAELGLLVACSNLTELSVPTLWLLPPLPPLRTLVATARRSFPDRKYAPVPCSHFPNLTALTVPFVPLRLSECWQLRTLTLEWYERQNALTAREVEKFPALLSTLTVRNGSLSTPAWKALSVCVPELREVRIEWDVCDGSDASEFPQELRTSLEARGCTTMTWDSAMRIVTASCVLVREG